MALGNKTLADLVNPISKQLGNAKVAEHVDMPKWEFIAQRVTDGKSHDELVSMFEDEAEKIHISVAHCKAADLAACLAKIVGAGVPESGEPCTVVYAADERFRAAGLADALAGESLVTKATEWDETAGEACVEDARVATYGITYATAGIAETATIAQPTCPTCGRAISLLPLCHIAVVDAAAIVPTMREVMADLAKEEKLPSQVCFISGPSATADIELVRVEGVHGPMYVNYVVVD